MSGTHELSLAAFAGVPMQAVIPRFRRSVRVSLDPTVQLNPTYRLAFAYAANLLARAFPNTYSDSFPSTPLESLLKKPQLSDVRSDFAVELVFGSNASGRAGEHIYASCERWLVFVGSSSRRVDCEEGWNPIVALIMACYAAARTAKAVLGDCIEAADRLQPFSILDFRQADVRFDWGEPLPLGVLQVAGVGAIGTAFLFALAAHGASTGKLILIDGDTVENRNLESYSLFDETHLGKNKALIAEGLLRNLGLAASIESYPQTLGTYVAEQCANNPDFRLSRLICAPDRRDTRREFQRLLPREVWDASTGPNDVVVHHNRFDPRLACLGCIYPPVPEEDLHAQHVAEMLGLPLEAVRSGYPISQPDAEKIRARYPLLRDTELVGRPHDTIFKQLCSAVELRVPDASQVILTPFPFVSGLAGVLLYFEFLKSIRCDVFEQFQEYNYVRLNPFYPPNSALRMLRLSRPACPICQEPSFRRHFNKLWNVAGAAHIPGTASGSVQARLI